MVDLFKVRVGDKLFGLKGEFQQILVAVKKCPGRVYNPALKEWFIPAYYAEDSNVLSLLKKSNQNNQESHIPFVSKEIDISHFPDGYDYLFPFQKEGILQLLDRKVLLCDEVGLGKSAQSLVYAKLLKAKRVLIVCPAPLKYQWSAEISKFLGMDSVVIDGTPSKRSVLWNRYFSMSAFSLSFCIMNYEQLLVGSEQLSKTWDLIIFDEIHKIKNWRSKTYRQAKKLRAVQKIGLTATPFVNNPIEFFTIVSFLTYFMNMKDFKDQYCEYDTVWNGRQEISIITGYKNLLDLHKKINHLMVRRRKKEVMQQLPERFYVPYEVMLPHEQKEIVNQCVDNMRLFYHDEGPMNNEFLAWLTMARMACDSTELLNQSNSSYAIKTGKVLSGKMDLLKEVLATTEGKIVIFTQWEKMAHIIERELGKENCTVITGSVQDKQGEILRFKENLGLRFLIVTDCLNYGVNLEFVNMLCHFDLPWTPAKVEQREGRIDRITQKRDMTIIHLLCKGTIEEVVFHKLVSKQQMFHEVIEGQSMFSDNVFMKDVLKEYFKDSKEESAQKVLI